MPFYCCVPGCTVKKVRMYTFPIKDKEVFDIWVKRISNPKFKHLSDEKIGKSYRICPKHFSDECKIPGSTKLKFYSLPTLNVPGNILNDILFKIAIYFRIVYKVFLVNQTQKIHFILRTVGQGRFVNMLL